MKRVIPTALVLACALANPFGSRAEAQVQLTGANLWYYGSSGQFWNTLGGDGWFNLYLSTTADQTGIINPGDGASATPNYNLATGTHFFHIFGSAGGIDSWSMNLFFDGAAAPGISAIGKIGSPAFWANTDACTNGLVASTCYPASGSLDYTNAGYTVTMTTAQWFAPKEDFVGWLDSSPDGANDYMGTMTLSVAASPTVAVPEPASIVLLATGLLGLGAARRMRRATSVTA